ncbi:uncharacterized protein LOC106165177 isoform X1 [Lingula anatina]|uniref:Uncharacterized protein LOC106165177 isoform X1 n=1 Tax=Lingula anatina TaxID=7574 RepID=A0A1S3ILG8_LINAN|nr:uncharacterized protein LOC106165177 isoform X1 [Lingula anatina]|eukprot:XP_013398736.1 uncharacterized protein LOC106165177 isoform X1 [Lingula anatina]
MDKREDERFQASHRRPTRSVENKENMENFSKYLAEMLPEEKVAMERGHRMMKLLLGNDSDPARNKVTELYEQMRNAKIFSDLFKGNAFVNSSFGLVESYGKALPSLIQTNSTCYQFFPYQNIEQWFEHVIPLYAREFNPEMIDMPSYIQLKVIGSTVDGLAVPLALHKEDKTHNIPIDIDVMLVLSPPYFPTVTSRRESVTTTKGPLWLRILSPPYYPTFTSRRESFVVDGRGCHAGYVKLKIQGQHWLFEVPDILERDRGDLYLSNTCVQHYIKNVNSSSGPLRKMLEKFRVRVHLHGPAATYEILSSMHDKDDLLSTGDFVASFPWNEFPREAEEWLSRKRSSGWPNMEQIQAVKEFGCHLVPVANPGDKDCRTEWRISFVLAERHLALSLNQVQRHVYRIIKLIHKHLLGESCTLSSYHLKTTLFWLCERIPQDRWTNEEMGQRFYDFYDLLLEFLDKKCIPNYFIQENNMIDYVDEKVVSDIVHILYTILDNPKAVLTEIQTNYEIHFNLMNHTFLNRFFQDILKINLQVMVDSPDIVLDSVFGAPGGAVDAFSKNDTDNPLRKEKEDSDSDMGAVGGAIDAFSNNDSDNPLRLETERLTRLILKDVCKRLLEWVPNSADGVDIFEEMRDFLKDALTLTADIDEEDPSHVELLVNTISLLTALDSGLKQRPADEHVNGQEARSRKLSYLTHDQNDDQHNAVTESFDSLDENQKTQSGNKKNRLLELVKVFVDTMEGYGLELEQTPEDEHADDQEAALGETLYQRNDEFSDRYYAERESSDSLDEDQSAPSGNKKNRLIGKRAGQLDDIDLD